MQPTKLYESLFILHKCNLNIERLRNLLQSFEGNLENNSDYALLFTYYINLEALSFLEEFRDSFSKVEQQYSDRVREVRKITSPVLKRIHKWKDLEKFRNNIVAHPWRHKGQFVVPNQGFYNIPRNWFEVVVLVNLMNYLWTLIKAEFEKEYADSLKYVATLETKPKPPNDYSHLNSDHLAMADEVEMLCKSFNKNYYLKVFQYILPDDKN
jgi:hypothetical protein